MPNGMPPNNSRKKAITESTLVPISLVISLLSGMKWLANIDSDLRHLQGVVAEVRSEVQEHRSLSNRIAILEEQVSRLERKR